jgi:mitogen-activated protein kinase kinase kinase 7
MERTEAIHGARYTTMCDVYSFGICMWEVLSRRVPYDDHTIKTMSDMMQFMQRVANVGLRPTPMPGPAELDTLIRECWTADEKCRPTAVEVHERLAQMLSRCSV